MVQPTGKGDVRLRALPSPSRIDGPISLKNQRTDSGHSIVPGLSTTPVQKKSGAWLSAVRGIFDRSAHSIDVERVPFDLAEAKARGGAAIDRLFTLAVKGSSGRQKTQLSRGEASWSSFYRVAAKGAFGNDYVKTIRYAQIESRMRELGLHGELEAMLTDLPREKLNQLRARGIAPVEIFDARAGVIGSWSMSPHPMSLDELRGELKSDKRSAELESLSASDLERIESGAMTGVQIARLLQERKRQDVDVLVIGAGAAGIGAANSILDGGLSVTVLEAKDRDGGRAFTEYDAFGFAFDHGCAWIHESEKNPFMAVVEALGYETITTEKFQKVFVGGDPVEDAKLLRERMNAVAGRWQAAAKKRPDAPASMVSAPEHRLDPMAAEVLGPLELALELDQFAVGEFQSIVEEKNDRLVKGGLGNVVHAFAQGLPIELESPAEIIKWSKEGVEVESNGRVFRAKELVLTVSPAVLRKMKFDPPLPEWKLEAIERMQMASFEKVALRFAPGTLDGVAPFERACGFDREGRSFELLMKPWGQDVAVLMDGADTAKDKLAEPEQASIDHAIDVLAHHYGEHVRAAFQHGERTEWTLDPHVLGTWAVSKVGTDTDRTAYAAPVEGVLRFAGEACGGEWAATVNGAFFNGHDVGAEVVLSRAARRVG
jgi:monoamine oxidase